MYCPMQLGSTAQQLCSALCVRLFTKVSSTFTDQTFNEAHVTFILAMNVPSPTEKEAKGPCLHNLAPRGLDCSDWSVRWLPL